MNVELSKCQCIGAMLPPHGKSSFDEADLIVKTGANYVRLTSYLANAACGESLSEADWQLLLADGQALQYDFGQLALKTGAVLWAFRSTFEDRDSALLELCNRGVLLAPIANVPAALPGASDVLALVVRSDAMGLRERWREHALDLAERHAKLWRWAQALTACEQAFALASELDARILGLLTLSYEREKREKRAAGYLQMAERSKGQAFREEVEAHRDQWKSALPKMAPRKGPSDSRPWAKESKEHVKDSQNALVPRTAA
jgi:hypothetical protein